MEIDPVPPFTLVVSPSTNADNGEGGVYKSDKK